MSRKLVVVLSLFVLLSSSLYVRFTPVKMKAANGYPVYNLDTGLKYATNQEAINSSSIKISNLLPRHGIMPLAHNGSSFTPVVANVCVLYPDDQLMSDVTVVAINHEYYFRYNERTNASGWATFRAMLGNWSFFAYPGWGKATTHKGIGYLPCALNQTLTDSVEEIVLKPDTEVQIVFESSVDDLKNFDMADLTIIESNAAWSGRYIQLEYHPMIVSLCIHKRTLLQGYHWQKALNHINRDSYS